MFQAQYLFGGTTLFSPWMSRQGDNVRLLVDFIDQDTSELAFSLYQKNSQDPGEGEAHPGGSLIMTGPGQPNSITYEGVEELVRLKIAANGSGANYALFRMLPNMWFDDVKPA